jgi:hypothetical protein
LTPLCRGKIRPTEIDETLPWARMTTDKLDGQNDIEFLTTVDITHANTGPVASYCKPIISPG